MTEKTTYSQNDLSYEISVLKKQLAISLKFHHGETLGKLPKEVALQAMMDVWESCHPEAVNRVHNSVVYDAVPKKPENTIYL